MTVVDFITDVLRQLTIISEIETPSAEQGQDALTKLNDMMADLEEDGIVLGYNPKATTAEDIVVPDGEKAGLKAMLGVRVCEGYGLPVPAVMGAMANAWYNRALRKSIYANARSSVPDSPAGENNPYRQNILTGQ